MAIAEKAPPERRRVGLIFDDRMCRHRQPGGKHPENPERIRAIWDKLKASGLVQRCVVLNAKEAEDKHLGLVHSKEHIDLIKTISSNNLKMMRKRAKLFDSIYFNKGSSEAAYLAAGSVIEAAEKVAKGELDSAFAIVRPPGHHAEESEPMGFCLYNNVAVATSFLLNEKPELGIRKILIVDWDVHHGNSTQKMFYKDPHVLFFSVHRHDSGTFYPEGDDGAYNMIGEGRGAGYNINVPWEHGGVGDADYFAVWDHLLIPVAKEFDPHMIIISAGFDAAIGDPIGGCCLSSYGFSVMLDKLMEFAGGKIVMALEGGYNLDSLANSTQACVEVLLQDKPRIRSLEKLPLESTWPLIQTVRQALCTYWPVLAHHESPEKVINSRSLQIEVDAQTHSVRSNSEIEHASISGRENYFGDRQGIAAANTRNKSNQTMLAEFQKSEDDRFADKMFVKSSSNSFDEKCSDPESQADNLRLSTVDVAQLREEVHFPASDLRENLKNVVKILRTNSIRMEKGVEKVDKKVKKIDKALEQLEARMLHMKSKLHELLDSAKRKNGGKTEKWSNGSRRKRENSESDCLRLSKHH